MTVVAGPDGGGVYTVTGRGFAHPGFTAAETGLTLLGQALTLGAAADPAVGEYLIDDAETFRFRPFDETPRGTALPLRFVARGASAPPLWVILS